MWSLQFESLDRLTLNRGLGAVVAEKFAAEGCNLAINYLFSQEKAEELATELAKKHSITAVTIQGVRNASSSSSRAEEL